MKTIKLSYPHKLKHVPETVAAIGFFDGIHQGHQEVIQTAVNKAKEENLKSAVITFHPHPSVVLNKEVQHVQYITPLKEKEMILNKMNVDRLYIIEFNQQLAQLSPQQFIKHFIINLNIKHLVAGFDYTFGHKGKGNMENIEQFTKDFFTYTVIKKVIKDEEKVSSTKIRYLLEKGRVDEVNNLLSRPFVTEGTVIEGDKRGRTIGYPTANLNIDEDILLPKSGVYAVKIHYKNTTFKGMANIGTRPTFIPHAEHYTVEVYILDFDQDVYGELLQVEWHQFIRDEKKFANVEELVKQLKKDEINIRNYFKQIV